MKYTDSYSKKINGLNKSQLWKTWTNVNQWSTWQDDLDFAQMNSSFSTGNFFVLKPKGGPQVSIQLIDVIDEKSFTDMTSFPLAKMYGRHDFIDHSDGSVEIKTTMSIQGPLAFLWKALVYNDIVKKLESQTEALIQKSKG